MALPRLVLASAYGGPYDGSFIPMVRSLCLEAARRGWSAEAVFSPDAGPRPWFERLSSEIETRLAPDASRRELAAWFEEEVVPPRGPVVLHTHFTRYDLAALEAARGRAPSDPAAVLWHVHTPLWGGLRPAVQNAVKYGVLGRRVQAILASGAGPAASVRRAGAPRDRLEIAGSGVRTDRFPLSTPAGRDRARDALGIPRTATVLLHFGWHWDMKDGDLFLAAVRELAIAQPERELVALTVSVDPAASDAVAHAALGPVRLVDPSDDVAGFYAAADVFVSSSRVEGEPFAVIEAILSGLPVAATDLPGHRAVCGDLESCRISDRTPAGMANAIASLLGRDPSRAAAERSRARELVAARFDLAGWTERMFVRYEEALGRVR